MTKLALLGGSPVITEPGPHFSWPPITEETTSAVVKQLSAGISIYDRSGVVQQLEDALVNYFGVRHALLTSSGTAALYSMYAACSLQQGDEVIVPAYTFFATVTPLFHLGVKPVLAECDARGNLDPTDAVRRITPRTRAIVATHMWGTPADMIRLRQVADQHGLMLLEDASHAHGAHIDGRKAGTFGRAGAFSLNGPKPLSAGEGGFIVTNNDGVYYRALLHGQYNKRCRTEIPSDFKLAAYATTGMGLKHRIHPLAATIALDQLTRLDDYLEGREAFATYLRDNLNSLPGLEIESLGPDLRSSWYGLILNYKCEELGGLPIERFVEALHAEGCIEVDRPSSTCPLNLLPLFQEPYPLFPEYPHSLTYRPGDFPRAEAVHRGTLKLPVWHREDEFEIAQLYVMAFRKVISHFRCLLE